MNPQIKLNSKTVVMKAPPSNTAPYAGTAFEVQAQQEEAEIFREVQQ